MRRDSELLNDIYNASKLLETFTANLTQEKFAGDPLIHSACFYQMIVMGEAARCLSANFLNDHTQIPWSKIVKNRNFLAHTYEGIDWIMVWDTITQDAIPLSAQIYEILKGEYPETAISLT